MSARLGNIVALCDIDDQRLGSKGEKFPEAKKYADFRKLLEELAPKIDAVVVSTPDHTHAPAAVMAMRLGKPVYCQKPLAHSPYEARVMRETAAKMKVATQMGNQGTSHPGFRSGIELIRSGVVGPIREVHVWTNRPFKYWKQAPDIVARPEEMPVPAHVPGICSSAPPPSGRTTRFTTPTTGEAGGTSAPARLGDMACHTANLAFMALKLGLPTRVSAEQRRGQPGNLSRLGYHHLRVPGAWRAAAGEAHLVRGGHATASATSPRPTFPAAKAPPTAARSWWAKRARSSRRATTARSRFCCP